MEGGEEQMGKFPSKPLSLPHFLSKLGRQENIPKITLHPLPSPNQTTLLFELPPILSSLYSVSSQITPTTHLDL